MSYDCSVRVSNELGAAHPRVAKLSVFVVNGNSIIISVVLAAIIMIFRVALSKLFTSDAVVLEAVSDLTPLLAISVLLNGIQPILSGNQVIIKNKHHFWFFHTSESDHSLCFLLF
jgi:MATE family multidrug resistance protein